MKKTIISIVGLLFFAAAGFSQTPTPTPTPNADSDVVKISTALIQLDVTVTDRNGKVAGGLKPEDFEIFENDKKQSITTFSYVESAPAKQNAPDASAPNRSDAPVASALLRPEQVRRTIALVVDDLGLSAESILSVKKALKKFVDEQMQPNDLVAIVRTGSGVGALQQFTSDKNLLYSAIEKIRWNPIGRSGVGAFNPIEPTLQELIQANTAVPSRAGSVADQQDAQLDAERDRIAVFNELREDLFTIGTLGALDFVVRGMSDLPGRKTMMVFSDGFSYCTKTDSKKDAARCTKMEDALRQLTDLCNRSSVTIYTQDARGLMPTGLTAQDNPVSLPNSLPQKLRTRTDELQDRQQGLGVLAGDTGGRAVVNTNDLNLGLTQMLEDTKGYYLIGYQPDSDSFDPKTHRFNKLSVRVRPEGLSVRYRSGYFGVSDEDLSRTAAQTETPARQIIKSLLSPFAANGIGLKLNTLFGKDDKNNAFVQSFLHIDAKDLIFTDAPDGQKQATIDVVAVSFGENGAIVDQFGQNYTIRVKPEDYQKKLTEGFVYNFVFPVKKPGAYQMRVAIRDAASAKIGSAGQFIEVPDLKGGELSVSGIVLENFTLAQWKALASQNTGQRQLDLLQDTSLRRFRRGTILSYTAEIYNARLDSSKTPQLETQIRIFRDGKPVLDGKPGPFDAAGQSNPAKLQFAGAIGLGSEMKPGDYVLQILIVDKLAKSKRRLADRWVQFELID
ncbi:MAG: VWA domain-containing protein [Acidobacteria bacterium]|nr:VWA domain-containing protein [Acidobacteriota bacterium]